jgi:hypothetical protein
MNETSTGTLNIKSLFLEDEGSQLIMINDSNYYQKEANQVIIRISYY